jgi:hypothetical protein
LRLGAMTICFRQYVKTISSRHGQEQKTVCSLYATTSKMITRLQIDFTFDQILTTVKQLPTQQELSHAMKKQQWFHLLQRLQ